MILKPLQSFITNQLLAAQANGSLSNPATAFEAYLGATMGGISQYFVLITNGLIDSILSAMDDVTKGIVDSLARMFGATPAQIDALNASIDDMFTKAKKEANDLSASLIAAINPPSLKAATAATAAVVPSAVPETSSLDGLIASANASLAKIDLPGLVSDAQLNLAGATGSVKSTALAAWNQMVSDATTGFTTIETGFKSFLNAIISMANVVIAGVNKLGTFSIGGVKVLTTNFPLLQTVGDFVMQPGGQLIKTSPADYIMGTTDPQSLAGNGGGNMVVNINVEGNMDDKTAKWITQQINQTFATKMRSISR